MGGNVAAIAVPRVDRIRNSAMTVLNFIARMIFTFISFFIVFLIQLWLEMPFPAYEAVAQSTTTGATLYAIAVLSFICTLWIVPLLPLAAMVIRSDAQFLRPGFIYMFGYVALAVSIHWLSLNAATAAEMLTEESWREAGVHYAVVTLAATLIYIIFANIIPQLRLIRFFD